MKDLLRSIAHEVMKDRLLGLSAQTAFFAVLSLFPGLLLASGLLSVLDIFLGADVADETQARVTQGLNLILTSQAADAVSSVERMFEGGYGGLLTVAGIGAILSISGAASVLVEALNLAYNTTELRTWWRRRLLGLGLGLATVLVVVVTLTVVVVGPLFGRGEDVANLIGLGNVFVVTWDLLRLPALFVAVTLWLMLVYRYAPNRRISWPATVPGALGTAVLWLVATGGLHLYLRIAGERNPVLGAFGGGAIIMIWVYLLCLALLVGGELNSYVAQRRRGSAAGTT